MSTKSIILILMPIALSACASTDTSKTATSDEKTHVAGSHIVRKNTDGVTPDPTQNLTGQQAAALMRNSLPTSVGGQGR